jgi:hypothetical protein
MKLSSEEGTDAGVIGMLAVGGKRRVLWLQCSGVVGKKRLRIKRR